MLDEVLACVWIWVRVGSLSPCTLGRGANGLNHDSFGPREWTCDIDGSASFTASAITMVLSTHGTVPRESRSAHSKEMRSRVNRQITEREGWRQLSTVDCRVCAGSRVRAKMLLRYDAAGLEIRLADGVFAGMTVCSEMKQEYVSNR